MQGTLLDQHGGHGSTALVQSGLDGGSSSVHVGIGPQIQVGISRQENGFEQLIDVGAHLGGDVDEHGVAAVLLGNQTELGQLSTNLFGVGPVHIDLVDRHDNRHMRRLGVVDGLDRLGHNAVIRSNDQNRHVGQLGTSGSHGREGLVTRGIQEGDLAILALQLDGGLVGTDPLGDATGLACRGVGLPDGIQQSRLTVIDMAHDRNHRGPRLQVLVVLAQLLLIKVDVELLKEFLVLLLGGDDLDVPANLLTQNLEGGLVQGLRGRSHLAQVEEDRDQGRGIDVDLVGQIGQGCALTELNGTSVTGGDAHTADDGCLHLLEFLPLGHPVLTGLGGLAALAPECTCGTAPATTTRRSATATRMEST